MTLIQSAIARTSSCFAVKELIVWWAHYFSLFFLLIHSSESGNPSLVAKITRNDELDGKDENNYHLDTIKIDVRRYAS